MNKKCLLFLVGVLIIVCFGCAKVAEDNFPTGYSTSVQRPQVMYNEKIYYYQAEEKEKKVPDGYSMVGSIEKNNDDNVPEDNYCGSLVNVGQKIYANSEQPNIIYVEYEKGYAKFGLLD